MEKNDQSIAYLHKYGAGAHTDETLINHIVDETSNIIDTVPEEVRSKGCVTPTLISNSNFNTGNRDQEETNACNDKPALKIQAGREDAFSFEKEDCRSFNDHDSQSFAGEFVGNYASFTEVSPHCGGDSNCFSDSQFDSEGLLEEGSSYGGSIGKDVESGSEGVQGKTHGHQYADEYENYADEYFDEYADEYGDEHDDYVNNELDGTNHTISNSKGLPMNTAFEDGRNISSIDQVYDDDQYYDQYDDQYDDSYKTRSWEYEDDYNEGDSMQDISSNSFQSNSRALVPGCQEASVTRRHSSSSSVSYQQKNDSTCSHAARSSAHWRNKYYRESTINESNKK